MHFLFLVTFFEPCHSEACVQHGCVWRTQELGHGSCARREKPQQGPGRVDRAAQNQPPAWPTRGLLGALSKRVASFPVSLFKLRDMATTLMSCWNNRILDLITSQVRKPGPNKNLNLRE